MSAAFDAIVIGAGANGLVAATALARNGKRTLLVDRASAVGGQAASIEFAPGFRASPLALDADWLPPVVRRGIGVAPPDVVGSDFSVALGGNAFFTLSRDAGLASDAIRHRSARDADAWPGFLAVLHSIAGFLEHLYQTPPIDIDASGPAEIRGMAALAWRFRTLGRRRMTDVLRVLPMSVEELLDDTFEDGGLKAALATAGIHGIRQGPRSGGTAFVMLHYLMGGANSQFRRLGYWRTGAHALVSALENVARQAGVVVRGGTGVAGIRIHDDAVTGIVLESGEDVAAPLILSSADPHTTMCRLVDPVWLDPEFLHAIRNVKYRGSTALVLYALDSIPAVPGLAQPEHSLAGWLSLSPDIPSIERAYDATKYGEISHRPHIEITMPSLRWPDTAPAGRHVLIARVQYVPWHLRGGAAWDDSVRCQLADAVTSAISEIAPAFADRILHRSVLAPVDLENRFGCHEGAFSHGEMMLDQILFMRPVPGWGRYAMPIRGLYLCGAGAHPGPGIPGGPGWLAAQAALAGEAE